MPPTESPSETPDADTIISLIIRDISGRKGIGDEWDNIDVDVRSKIVRKWRTFFAARATETGSEA